VKSEIAEILDRMKGLVAGLQEQVASFDEAAVSRVRSDRFRVFLQSVAQLRAFQEDLSMACRKEGFKKGGLEAFSEEDYETHYNLGVAYREMGLLDGSYSNYGDVVAELLELKKGLIPISSARGLSVEGCGDPMGNTPGAVLGLQPESFPW
jgi:hypothetical protein